MLFFKRGFTRLDFSRARAIADLVGFDARACARTKRSCGPGCDYLVNDKRYYVSMLLKHIAALERSGRELPAQVRQWRDEAQAAAKEYADIEASLVHGHTAR